MTLIDRVKKRSIYYHLLPIPFLLPGITNIILYYVGIANASEESSIKSQIFAAVQMIGFAFVLVLFFSLWKKQQFSFLFLLKVILLPLFILGCIFVTIIQIGTPSIVLNNLYEFGVFSIPAYLIGIYCVKEKLEIALIQTIEKWGVVLLPAAVIYIFQVIFIGTSLDLGMIDYGTVGMTFFPPMIASLILQFYTKSDTARPANPKGLAIYRACSVMIFWTAIVITGVRGTMIGAVIFIILLLGIAIVKKNNRKPMVLHTIGMMLIFVCISYLVLPNVNSGILARVDVLSDTSFYTIPKETTDAGHGIIQYDKSTLDQIANMPGPKNTQNIDGPNIDTPNIDGPLFLDRPQLYYLTLVEIRKHPLLGTGSMTFQLKYGSYPHNFILELLSELGIIIGGAFVLFLLALMIRLLKIQKSSIPIQMMTLLIIGFTPKLLLSGTFWCMPILLFAMGYMIFLKKSETNV